LSKLIGYIIFAFFLLIQIPVYAKCTYLKFTKYAVRSATYSRFADTGVKQTDLALQLKPKKWRHYKRGDTLYYCDVLKLRSLNYKEHIFAVFGFAHIYARRSRSKLKIKYVLKRENHYLSTIFYTKAVRLERKRVDTGYKAYMKILEKKFPSIMMWGILDANAIGNVITGK
jgi:hypothetical protein